MHTKDKGDISEANILARFKKRGYNVLTPFGDNQRYDFVLDLDGSFITVQCKTVRLRNDTQGCLTFKACSTNWNKKTEQDYKGEVDIFAVYSPDFYKVFVLPVEDVGVKSHSLRYKMSKNNQRKNINWAVDYLF